MSNDFDEIMNMASKVFEEQVNQEAHEATKRMEQEEQDVFKDEMLVLRKQKIDGMDYIRIEHKTNHFETPRYRTLEEQIHTYYEVLDLALLIRDFKWTKELHSKIQELEQQLKERDEEQ